MKDFHIPPKSQDHAKDPNILSRAARWFSDGMGGWIASEPGKDTIPHPRLPDRDAKGRFVKRIIPHDVLFKNRYVLINRRDPVSHMKHSEDVPIFNSSADPEFTYSIYDEPMIRETAEFLYACLSSEQQASRIDPARSAHASADEAGSHIGSDTPRPSRSRYRTSRSFYTIPQIGERTWKR